MLLEQGRDGTLAAMVLWGLWLMPTQPLRSPPAAAQPREQRGAAEGERKSEFKASFELPIGITALASLGRPDLPAGSRAVARAGAGCFPFRGQDSRRVESPITSAPEHGKIPFMTADGCEAARSEPMPVSCKAGVTGSATGTVNNARWRGCG